MKLALIDELAGKAMNLSYRGVIPLLTVKQEGRNYIYELPVGTTVWSLVPYGKGWISDPKPLGSKDGGYTPWALGQIPAKTRLLERVLPILPSRTPLAGTCPRWRQ